VGRASLRRIGRLADASDSGRCNNQEILRMQSYGVYFLSLPYQRFNRTTHSRRKAGLCGVYTAGPLARPVVLSKEARGGLRQLKYQVCFVTSSMGPWSEVKQARPSRHGGDGGCGLLTASPSQGTLRSSLLSHHEVQTNIVHASCWRPRVRRYQVYTSVHLYRRRPRLAEGVGLGASWSGCMTVRPNGEVAVCDGPRQDEWDEMDAHGEWTEWYMSVEPIASIAGWVLSNETVHVHVHVTTYSTVDVSPIRSLMIWTGRPSIRRAREEPKNGWPQRFAGASISVEISQLSRRYAQRKHGPLSATMAYTYVLRHR